MAGQAFAKHYNPLLSGETSYGSQHSSGKQSNGIAFRRFGEQVPSEGYPVGYTSKAAVSISSSSYAAPNCQAMQPQTGSHTEHQQQQPPELEGNSQGVAPHTLQQKPQTVRKQSAFGKQLSDALKLRNWVYQAQTATTDHTSQPPSSVCQSSSLSGPTPLEPIHGKAPMLRGKPGVSETAGRAESNAEVADGLLLPEPRESPVATLRVASAQAVQAVEACTPASPALSIAGFSSTSSWGKSSELHSVSSHASRISSAFETSSKAYPGKASGAVGQAAALHSEAKGSAVTQAQDAAKVQSRLSNASAMHAMHDSSSSWTDRLVNSTDEACTIGKAPQEASLDSRTFHSQQHNAVSSSCAEDVDQGKTAKLLLAVLCNAVML